MRRPCWCESRCALDRSGILAGQWQYIMREKSKYAPREYDCGPSRHSIVPWNFQGVLDVGDVGLRFSGLGRGDEPVGLGGTVPRGIATYYDKVDWDGGCFISRGHGVGVMLC